MEIEQTARPLETNAHANFPMIENAGYECMENGGGKLDSHWQFYGSLCVSGIMLRQSQGPRRVSWEHVECFHSIVRHMNAEQQYY